MNKVSDSQLFALSKIALITIVFIVAASGAGVYFLLAHDFQIEGVGSSTSTYSISNSVSTQGSSNQSVSIPCGGGYRLAYHCDYSGDGFVSNESAVHSPALS